MRRYFAEFNRVIGDNIRRTEQSLRQAGLGVTVLPHKTSLVIERPSSVSWTDLKNAIRAVLQPRRGSVIISSESTGKTFICQNGGNSPGLFKRQ